MGLVVLDDINNNDCDGTMDGDYEDDNGDGAMDDYDEGDNGNVDGDGAIDDNDDDSNDENDGDNNVVAQMPAHRQRRRHRQNILSRGRRQGNKIIPSFICC